MLQGNAKQSTPKKQYSSNCCYYVVCLIAGVSTQAEDNFTINDEGKEPLWRKGIVPHLQAAKGEIAEVVDHPVTRVQVGTGQAQQAISQETTAGMPQRGIVRNKKTGRMDSARLTLQLHHNGSY